MTAQAIAPVEPARRSVLMEVANRYGMEPGAFEQTLRNTVVPGSCTKEQFAAFLVVAREHDLNPLTKEIYAFPAKGGGITPIVGVDGWIKLANRQPEFDGIEFEDHFGPDGKLISVTSIVHRKDRSRPTRITEYMTECVRQTDPWKTSPSRMLRHKALIQGVRVAFGFAGLMDEDDAYVASMRDVTPLAPRPTRAQIAAVQPTETPDDEADAANRALDREAERIINGTVETEEGAAIDPAIINPEPRQIDVPMTPNGRTKDWRGYVNLCKQDVEAAPSADFIDNWRGKQGKTLDSLRLSFPDGAKELDEAIAYRLAELAQANG